MAKKKAAAKDPLDLAIDGIHKDYGLESLISMDEVQDVECVSSGSLRLDEALGRGIPRGRIIELFGPESSGKTTLCLSIMAQFQKLGLRSFFVDAEHAFDPVWAETNGVSLSPELFRFCQPHNGEEALQITEKLVVGGAPLVVVDSVAALVPKAELDGQIGDAHVGRQARLMSQAMRKLTGVTKTHNSTILFINQIREAIGVTYGSPYTTPGGRALKFYASQRLDVRRAASIKPSKEADPVGIEMKVSIVKNKVAPPFKKASVKLLFDAGISLDYEALDIAIEKNLIPVAGSWITLGDEKIQGKDTARLWLADHPEVRDELIQKVKEAANDSTGK